MNTIIKQITDGNTSLGIELGSTRIKAVLLSDDGKMLAQGNHDWENELKDGVWTYSLERVSAGLKDSYAKLKTDVKEKYGVTIKTFGSMGISAMMHGYLAFDKDDNLLVPFRTWRNMITPDAAEKLTKEFNFNIPQRWSIAHLEQAIINGESHIGDIAFITTLSGYVHYMLTGKKVLGVGDASGMFPIDSTANDYNQAMIEKYDELHAADGFGWKIRDILPKVLCAGENAGTLTAEGAKFLDADGDLEAGIICCPPEGDAGTGMVATNSIKEKTGNVSAGTSIFSMIVLEKELANVYEEIDLVTTPDGKPVAMVHCNNCTSDIDAWVKLFSQVLDSFGCEYKKYELYDKLYNMALSADENCGGVVTYNLFSGETILDNIPEGRPMMVRMPDADFSFPNLAKSLIYSSFATLKIGMDILTEKENVKVEMLLGHGGLFKTKDVAQILMSSALSVPVSVMTTAAEGGAWGIATLAQYLKNKAEGETLSEYLDNRVFASAEVSVKEPDAKEKAVFDRYIEKYTAGVEIQKTAINCLK